MPAAPPPPVDDDGVPPRAATAIAAALDAIAGRPVAEADPAARRAATVIRAIQAHCATRAATPAPAPGPAGEGG